MAYAIMQILLYTWHDSLRVPYWFYISTTGSPFTCFDASHYGKFFNTVGLRFCWYFLHMPFNSVQGFVKITNGGNIEKLVELHIHVNITCIKLRLFSLFRVYTVAFKFKLSNSQTLKVMNSLCWKRGGGNFFWKENGAHYLTPKWHNRKSMKLI